jgi:uncharacterized damage-inducible protein DinB
MDVGITLGELLAWNDEAAGTWNTHLELNPLLDVVCDIGDTKNVQGLVRHIWGAELRWAQRLVGLPVMSKEAAPKGPLEALFNLHREAIEVFRNLLSAPERSWSEPFALDLDWVPEDFRSPSRRKVAVHSLIHSQRHWAQLATLARQAGYALPTRGDLLFSPALR